MEKHTRGKSGNSKRKELKKDESLNYYKRIDGFLTPDHEKDEDSSKIEEKREFFDNVFSQLAEEAMQVCQHPQISPIIERLVTRASAKNILSLLKALSKNWSIVCRHKCSSHVLQKALMVLPAFIKTELVDFDFHIENEEDDLENDEDSTASSLIRIVVELVSFFVANIEDSVKDVHMSHIFRAMLQLIGGTCVDEKVVKSRTSRSYAKHVKSGGMDGQQTVSFTDYEVPEYLIMQLEKINKKIFKLENFGVYLMDSNANPVIQTLLLVLHKVDIDLCQKVILKVIKATRIKETAGSDNIPPVAVDSVGSYLVELIVSLCSEELFTELYNKLFKGKLLQYATDSSANFVLQKLIRACPNEDMMTEIQEELDEHVAEIFKSQNYGVLVALADAYERFGSSQEKFVKMMMTGLHCENEDRQTKFVPLVASLRKFENFPKEENAVLPKVNYHGSLLLQRMLRFSDAKILTDSMESMEPDKLVNLSCDPCGSHVIDACFQNSGIPEDVKGSILDKFKKFFVILACDKNGSRCLECMWKNISVDQKTTIATDLCQFEDRIRSDRIGYHIHRNFALFHFKNRKKDWLAEQQSNQKKRKMFKDVLEKDKPAKKKKKKNRKQKQIKGQ